MNRRQRVQVTADPDRYFYVYTPEDILLQKLRWFRKGHEGRTDRRAENGATRIVLDEACMAPSNSPFAWP